MKRALINNAAHQFLAFSGTERRWIGGGNAARLVSMARPVQDADGIATELLGQFAGPATGTNQLDHLFTKLRRVRQLGVEYLGLLL